MKHRVVIISKDSGAKIFITPDPESYFCLPDEVLLVDPDTKMVNSFPPELWKLENDKLVPVTEPDEVARRMHNVKLLPKVAAISKQQDIDLLLMAEQVAGLVQLKDNLKDIADILHGAINGIPVAHREQISPVYLEQRHQRHWLVLIAFLLALALVYGVARIERILSILPMS